MLGLTITYMFRFFLHTLNVHPTSYCKITVKDHPFIHLVLVFVKLRVRIKLMIPFFN